MTTPVKQDNPNKYSFRNTPSRDKGEGAYDK